MSSFLACLIALNKVFRILVTLDYKIDSGFKYTSSEGLYRFVIPCLSNGSLAKVRVDAPGYELYNREVQLLEEIEPIYLIPKNRKEENSSTQIPTKVTPTLPSNSGSFSSTPTPITTDYKTNPKNRHKYFLTTSNTWQGAQKQAVEAGGNLVTINDAEEQKWLVNQFGNREQFWIGLHKNAGNGNFEWMSGQPVKYQNWDTGAPDNVQITPKGEVRPIGEDFVVMNFKQDGSGKWNDLCSCIGTFDNGDKHNSSSYRGLVEIEDKEQAKKNYHFI